jgi:hypothetical protein
VEHRISVCGGNNRRTSAGARGKGAYRKNGGAYEIIDCGCAQKINVALLIISEGKEGAQCEKYRLCLLYQKKMKRRISNVSIARRERMASEKRKSKNNWHIRSARKKSEEIKAPKKIALTSLMSGIAIAEGEEEMARSKSGISRYPSNNRWWQRASAWRRGVAALAGGAVSSSAAAAKAAAWRQRRRKHGGGGKRKENRRVWHAYRVKSRNGVWRIKQIGNM